MFQFIGRRALSVSQTTLSSLNRSASSSLALRTIGNTSLRSYSASTSVDQQQSKAPTSEQTSSVSPQANSSETTPNTTTNAINTTTTTVENPSEAKPPRYNLGSGKSYNGIPIHTPPNQFSKRSGFFSTLFRYTIYFFLFFWIFSGYPIHTVSSFIYRLMHGEPEEEKDDQ
ncbi:hypothetical protein C9374_012864 [Naegleria lovaniensis]|uniref:Uncharacterized protein n=1 Tax=Naegleria lovaniensis TaxID=51637 RepID=A0AA88KHR4_NAELO|nr:uncharacterized protein C9374_012864 [Naegleria lovaniensis]KAG2373132.1 hypothetical protein C9374_012864 [Naegleria lovaniensis]